MDSSIVQWMYTIILRNQKVLLSKDFQGSNASHVEDFIVLTFYFPVLQHHVHTQAKLLMYDHTSKRNGPLVAKVRQAMVSISNDFV